MSNQLIQAGNDRTYISDYEARVRQELESLLAESKVKLEQLNRASGELNNSLEELAQQRSAARDLINESYQSYKAVLEKCRDDAIKELNELHHERELKVMDMTEQVMCFDISNGNEIVVPVFARDYTL